MDRHPITATFVNLKPGTTKTTSAIFTAAAFHARGAVVLLVDADPAASALAWGDIADGFPWHTIGMPSRSIARTLPSYIDRSRPDVVIIDTPQLEDHAPITRGAMAVTDTWIVPVAPSGIEVDRTAHVVEHMDEVDAPLQTAPERLVLLTRTNRRRPPRSGPDAETRAAFQRGGLPVFPDQVPMNDGRFRLPYGTVPDASDTAYDTLADYLAAPDRAAWLASHSPALLPVSNG